MDDDEFSDDEDLDTLFERNNEDDEVPVVPNRESTNTNPIDENDNLEGNENVGGDNEAADDESRKVVAPKKKVVRKPQPKLNADRICGKQGITLLPKLFDDMKFKGKGHEKEDLNKMMGAMEHWAHRLFPQLPFDTVLDRIEKLGSKKPVQVYVKKMRMGLLLDTEEDRPIVDSDDENGTPMETQPGTRNNDLFEELLREAPPVDRSMHDDADNDSFFRESSTPVTVTPTNTMSEELRQKIARNRLLALERKRAREAAETSSSTDATASTLNVGLPVQLTPISTSCEDATTGTSSLDVPVQLTPISTSSEDVPIQIMPISTISDDATTSSLDVPVQIMPISTISVDATTTCSSLDVPVQISSSEDGTTTSSLAVLVHVTPISSEEIE